jgi:hypothetical protein
VTNTRPGADWDNRFRVDTVSVVGLPIVPVLQQTLGRTLAVLHDGKTATFSAETLTSDTFKGEKLAGTWVLRLSACVSGCAPPPAALDANVRAECSK